MPPDRLSRFLRLYAPLVSKILHPQDESEAFVTTDDFHGMLRKVYWLIFLPPYFSVEDDSATKGFLTKTLSMSKFLSCFYINLFLNILGTYI